jgi:CheY-like chemotaxis protein
MVEDNIMNRKYLGSLLDKKKIKWDIAVDGLEAVRKAGLKKYDAILMDIQMPNMNGYEATLSIRSTQNINNKTPIIALTASAMLDQKNKAFEVGMDDYISKPFTPQQLFDKLVIYLQIDGKKLQAIEVVREEIPPFQYDAKLDVNYLQELYADDYNYAFSMFDTFISDMMPAFDTLLSLANNNQREKLAKLAHQLKPTAAMVGLTELEKELLELEIYLGNPKPKYEQMMEKTRNIYAHLQAKKEIIIQQHTALKQLIL